MFAIFATIDVFNSWHEAIKLKLGYPIIGTNLATGLPDETNITTEYTFAEINPSDPRVIAWVGDETTDLTLIDPSDPLWVDWFPEVILNDANEL
jgi:hypothetical protein